MKKSRLFIGAAALFCCVPVYGDQMAHWANIRDDAGNIIGTVDAYSDVQVYGTCADNPGRTVVYDPNTGLYGSVASVYLYGGTDYEYEHPTEYAGYTYNYDYGFLEDTGYYPISEYSYVDPDRELYIPTYTADETYQADLYQVGEYTGGELWVDVNLTAQTVSLYNGDTLIASGYCVTGMPGYYETPVGTHYIMSKEANATLRGENPDGSLYECPVSYWMPFTESGCGLHDATWRSDFGGDIWQTSGSYGCVNMDYGTAETIFSMVDVGDPVEVHW